MTWYWAAKHSHGWVSSKQKLIDAMPDRDMHEIWLMDEEDLGDNIQPDDRRWLKERMECGIGQQDR